MSDEPNDNYPWTKLSRITMSDNANELWATRGLNDAQDVAGGGSLIVGKSAPTTSLLIESLIQQLCTMFEGDPVKRNKLYFTLCDKLRDMSLIDNSYNMDEFELMRGKYQSALYQLVTVARAAAGCQSIIQAPSAFVDWSRYRNEFVELSFIGSGGFGQVYKARHRLDGHEYAIKKICVRQGRMKNLLQHLDEVRTLAKLNHTNIVAYKGAWIEQSFPHQFLPYLSDTKHEFSSVRVSKSSRITEQRSRSHSMGNSHKRSMSSLCSESSPSKNSYHHHHHHHYEEQRNGSKTNYNSGCSLSKTNKIHESYEDSKVFKQQGSSSGIFHSHDIAIERFEQLNSTTNIIGRRIDERVSSRSSRVFEEGDSDVVSFRNDVGDSSSGNFQQNKSSEESDYSESPEENITHNHRVCQFNSSTRPRVAILYIHMALCDQTLREWMDKRVEPTPEPIIVSMLTQILAGLQYIHSRRTVHHDIKPSNIFIATSGQLHIQLGDFGLACPLQHDGHHPNLGTQLYAAPEQLSGECDPKSDVYSLGIILFELLVPMKTSMERISVINELKAGKISDSVALHHPKWAGLILRLVNVEPKMRPSPTELLNDLSEDKDLIIAQLTTDNEVKDGIIESLKQENQHLRDELYKLQTEMIDLKMQD